MAKNICTIKRAREILGKSASTSMECITKAQVRGLGGDETYLTKYISDDECVNEEDVVKKTMDVLNELTIISGDINIGIINNPLNYPYIVTPPTRALIDLYTGMDGTIMGANFLFKGKLISQELIETQAPGGIANGNINVVHVTDTTFRLTSSAQLSDKTYFFLQRFKVVVELNGKQGEFEIECRIRYQWMPNEN